MEPFMPHPRDEETIAAADPGPGAPPQADGVGTGTTSAEEFVREGRDPLTHEPLDASGGEAAGTTVGDRTEGEGTDGEGTDEGEPGSPQP
jgi:hypothetical protein